MTIDVKDIHFGYQQKPVLKGISFAIAPGEIVGLLGPNGAGKTTMIHLLLGLRTPTSGTVAVMGLDPIRFPRQTKTKIGVVHQKSNFDWDLTVEDNLDIYGTLFGVPAKQRRERIAELLDEFGLTKHAKQNIRRLSGGEQRRTQVARALLHRPQLLILDEPSANLDSQWRLLLQERIKVRARQDNVTVLWTSHDMREIQEATTRILLLNQGQIVADDVPLEFARKTTGELIRLQVAGEVSVLTGPIPGVRDYRWEDEWWVAHVDSAEECLPGVLRFLEHKRCSVTRVQLETATLEKAILKSNWGGTPDERSEGHPVSRVSSVR